MAKPKATKTREIPGKIIAENVNGFAIRRLRLKDIDRAHYNPREMSDRAAEGLGASLETFGLVEPLVWNVRFQRLVGGHQRLSRLEAAGVEETDVTQVDLDEVMEKALNAELNNKAIQGDFTASVADILNEVEAKRPELFSKLALDDLRLEIPEIPNLNDPDLPQVNETVKKKHVCPECGCAF